MQAGPPENGSGSEASGSLDSDASSMDEGTSSSDEEDEGHVRALSLREREPGGSEAVSGEGPVAWYRRRDRTGAPAPLAPQLLTLSLLPRTQWQSLMHLDAIKVGPTSAMRNV